MLQPESSTEPQVSIRSLEDIRDKHGLLVWGLYRLTDRFSKWSWGHRYRALPQKVDGPTQWLDTETGKPKPAWQDRATITPMVVLTTVSLALAYSGPHGLALVGAVVGAYSLFVDTLNYYVRVLWFDDLTPGIADTRRAVWSHRRILFLAILGYLQSILIFSAVYRALPATASSSFSALLSRSFFTATLLELPIHPTIVDAVQVLTSLFFVTIVIAVISATGYEREEVSRTRRS